VIPAVLVAGLALVAAGGVLAVPGWTSRWGLGVQAIGAAVVAASGFWFLVSGVSAGAAFSSHFALRFGVDPLSGFFLGTLGLVAAPALWFARDYLHSSGRDRVVGAMMAAFVLVLAAVVCARDPVSVLGGWELMTLLPAALILVAHKADRRARSSVFTYVAVTHLGGVGTWVAVLLVAKYSAMGSAAGLPAGSGVQAIVAVSALIGCGTKAGVMPLHVWLPRAHPIAPAPVSALMSGVMIKIAVYLLVRVLVDWAGRLPIWFGVVVVALGVLSALGGVLYAIFERDLKRLLAMCSIDNIGIIFLGLGACLLLRSRGAEMWAAVALGAALLHTLNHALFKSLLFLCSGAFERATGALDVDGLGGLLAKMPVVGGAFLVGAMAIAGLPPLNGFASEWLTLQSLVHVPRYGQVVDGLVGTVGLAALAATAALSLLCFVKVTGLTLLGAPRRKPPADAVMPSGSMGAATAWLAAGCVVLGFAPGVLFSRLAGLAPWPVRVPTRLGVSLPGTGGLPAPTLMLVLAGLSLVLLWMRGTGSAEAEPTWVCGQMAEPRLGWTSAGFTKPLRLALEPVLAPRREITTVEEAGTVVDVEYRGEVPHHFDERLYQPVQRRAMKAAAGARRLQSGSLGSYIAYLIGLVIVALLAVRLGLLG
jgi:hydrogenase-4 component B